MNTAFVTRVLLLTAILAGMNDVRAGGMNAWLDRTQIAEGETVQLTLELQGRVNGRPDTTPLEQDFEVLGLSTGSRVNIVNGRTDARTTWTLTLSPRRSGTLTIPALHVGSYRSAALQLEVADAPVPVAGSGADILIETDIEPRDPYVQGQVLYTVRLLHAVPVSNGQLSEPGSNDTLVQRLGEDREYTTTRGGRRYQVIERRYALFPQGSGSLDLPAPAFDGEIPDVSRRRASPLSRFFGNDSFFGRDPFENLMTPTRRVRVRGEAVTLDVKPRPDTAQGAHWLPSHRLELNGKWQPESARVQMGEPVTLTLDLEAEGLTAGQLPDLAPQVVAGFRIYPDQAQRHTEATGDGVTGRVQQKIAFLPEHTGALTLPDIDLHWWDTQLNQERIATLPSRIIEVLPAPGPATQATMGKAPSMASGDQEVGQMAPHDSAQDRSEVQQETYQYSPPWHWISVILATGWLFTLAIWWWQARRNRTVTGEKPPAEEKPASAAKARKQFLAACQVDDAKGAHAAVLAWAAAHWPDNPPRGLDALARRIHDQETQEAITDLNRALFKEDGLWKGAHLAERLQQLPERNMKAGAGKVTLAPLYPDSQSRSYP